MMTLRFDCEKDAFVLIEPEPPVEWAVFLIDNPRKAKRVEAETFMAARTIGAWRFELFEKQGWRDRDAPKVPDTGRVWAVRPRDGETGRDAIDRASGYLEKLKEKGERDGKDNKSKNGADSGHGISLPNRRRTRGAVTGARALSELLQPTGEE